MAQAACCGRWAGDRTVRERLLTILQNRFGLTGEGGFISQPLAIVVIATESGIGSYDDVLFWDHMVQHLLLLMVAPPLLVVGQPATLLLHASRNPLHTWAKRVLRSRVLAAITWPPIRS